MIPKYVYKYEINFALCNKKEKKEKNEIFTLMNYSVYIIGAIINIIF